MNKKYYIQDSRHYVGDSVLWWAKDRGGYTVDITRAHICDKQEAQEICSNRKNDIVWDKNYIDQKISSHVNAEHISREEMEELVKN